MIQTRFLVALFVLMLGRAAMARGDDPKPEAPPDPCVTDLTLEKLDNPPERKTKYEVVEEPWKEKLVDVKAADQKFAAAIRIELPKFRGAPFSDANKSEEYGRTANLELSAKWPDFIRLQRFREQDLMNPRGYLSRTREIDYKTLQLQHEDSAAPAMKRMLAFIPAQKLPSREYQEFFTNPENDRLLLIRGGPTSGSRMSMSGSGMRMALPQGSAPNWREILLLGKTPEQAKGRAEAFLSILDQGYTRPIQKELFNVRAKQCELLHEARAKRVASYQRWETVKARLKEYEEFTPDMLAGLRVQQLQLDVDLAGVKAKIATCEKLLDKMVQVERRKPIEDAKIAAEIELSGFEARRAKSAEFVAKLKERNTLSELTTKTENETIQDLRSVQLLENSIQQIDEDIAAFGPVRLVDDRVTIHPLEWTQ